MEQRNSGSSGLMQMEYQESCRRCRALVFLNPFSVLLHAPFAPFDLPPVGNLSATSSYLSEPASNMLLVQKLNDESTSISSM